MTTTSSPSIAQPRLGATPRATRLMLGCLLLASSTSFAHAKAEPADVAALMKDYPYKYITPGSGVGTLSADGATGEGATAVAEKSQKTAGLLEAFKSAFDADSSFGWGPGIGAIYTLGDRPVESAAVDGTNTVRLTTKSNLRTAALLEAHFLFNDLIIADAESKLSEELLKLRANFDAGITQLPSNASLPQLHTAWGILVAAEIGGENAIQSLGIGPVFAIQKYQVDSLGKLKRVSAINLSVVAFAQPNVKTVKGGYTDGQVVPAGTTLTLEDEARLGIGVIVSMRF